jgi:hypothetical protein
MACMSRKNSRRNNMMGGRKNNMMSRRNRKNTRRNNMMGGRKNNMMSRRNRKNTRRNNTSMNMPMMMGGQYDAAKLSLEQGKEYLKAHENQYGGAAPVGEYTLDLPGDLAPSSRLTQLDDAFNQIKGMSDFGGQTGGRRRKSKKSRKESRKSKKASRKSKKASRKSKKASRKSKKASRKNRKSSRRMRGGAMAGAPYNSPNMLLSPMMAAKAGTADFSNPLLKY